MFFKGVMKKKTNVFVTYGIVLEELKNENITKQNEKKKRQKIESRLSQIMPPSLPPKRRKIVSISCVKLLALLPTLRVCDVLQNRFTASVITLKLLWTLKPLMELKDTSGSALFPLMEHQKLDCYQRKTRGTFGKGSY